jgi:hypothetical protein
MNNITIKSRSNSSIRKFRIDSDPEAEIRLNNSYGCIEAFLNLHVEQEVFNTIYEKLDGLIIQLLQLRHDCGVDVAFGERAKPSICHYGPPSQQRIPIESVEAVPDPWLHGMFFHENGDVLLIATYGTPSLSIRMADKSALFVVDEDFDKAAILDRFEEMKRITNWEYVSVYRLVRILDTSLDSLHRFPSSPLLSPRLAGQSYSVNEVIR